jgi:plasmid stabilization system protein ParE
MARRKPLITVVIAPEAEDDLDEIFRYNIRKRGFLPAESYIKFLRSKIASLAFDYDAGKPVDGRPGLRSILMKGRGRWKHGHVAVYSVDDAESMVEILHVFHTKQDWEIKL